MKRALLLFGHETWPKAMKESAQMIAGEQEDLYALFVHMDDSAQKIQDNLDETMQTLKRKGYQDVLILLDLFGGSPSHVVAKYYEDIHVQAICGVNMPMLLEILMMSEDTSLQLVSEKALTCGKAAIINEFEMIKRG